MKKITVFFSLLLFATNVVASESSKKLVQKGYQRLGQQQFELALKDFQAASKADPNDGEALFFQGVALNRLGRFSEAGQKLDTAKKRGEHPDWNFERGWAYLGAGEWQSAIGSLKAYDKAHPGRGQTSEFIGRAYFGLEERERAEKYLNKALKQDPGLKKSATLYLSALASRGQPAEKPKNWKVRASVSGSYNTNVLNLGNGVARPTNISRQESGLANTVVGGSYRFDLSDASQLTLGNDAFSNFYEVTNRLNFFDNYTFVQFRHALGSEKVLGVTVSNDFSVVQTAKFRNQIGVRPVFGWRLTDWLISEVGYIFNYGKYFFRLNAPQRRTGDMHTASMNNYLSVPGTKLRFRLGYSHVWNRARGADFVYHGNSLIFAVSNPLFSKVAGELYFSQAWNRYDNVNSLTSGTRRSDNISNVLAQFRFPVGWKVDGYLRGGYTRGGSNINVFNYRAYQGSLGLSAAF